MKNISAEGGWNDVPAPFRITTASNAAAVCYIALGKMIICLYFNSHHSILNHMKQQLISACFHALNGLINVPTRHENTRSSSLSAHLKRTPCLHSFCLLAEMLWLFLLRLQLVYLDQSKEQCSLKMQRSTNLCLSVGHAAFSLAVRLIMKPILLTCRTRSVPINADSLLKEFEATNTEGAEVKCVKLKGKWTLFCKANTHRVHTQRTLTSLPRE